MDVSAIGFLLCWAGERGEESETAGGLGAYGSGRCLRGPGGILAFFFGGMRTLESDILVSDLVLPFLGC